VTKTTDPDLTDAQSLFDESMALNDARFDETYKYIIYEDNGPWSVRFTSWYIPGLLYRDQGNDLDNAKEAIENILACQLTDNFTAPWYGTWKLSPDGKAHVFISSVVVCHMKLTRS
jgi:hypothetical protein